MTVSDLRAQTRKQLASRAKRHQIAGWHEMTKDDLIRALIRRLRSTKGIRPSRPKATTANGRPARAANAVATNGDGRSGHTNGASKAKAERNRATMIASSVRRLLKPTALSADPEMAPLKDRISARPHDAYWIYAEWTLTQKIIDRAVAALGVDWHQAVPVLRLFDVTATEDATTSKVHLRDIEIHGEIDHWYVPVENPPRAYRVHIGYRAANGTFFTLAKSNSVQMPRAGAPSARNGKAQNGSANQEIGEDGAPKKKQNLHVLHVNRARESSDSAYNGSGFMAGFPFKLETELIVHGSTHPDAELTLLGDPVQVREDGTFSLRFTLPNGRQVIPAVCIHPHGAEQRTIVLGIERNTKELEPLPLDGTMQ